MDFYKFVVNVMSAERIVTQMYPVILNEFEKRFNITVKKSWIDVLYDPTLTRHVVRVIVETEKGRYYIPIVEISDMTKLYGVEYALKNMIPPFK
jgi:uncharacterized protein YlxP (DUF503 family)